MTFTLKRVVTAMLFSACSARGEHVDDGASLPRPPVPGGRGHRQNHEDAQKSDAQPPHLRTLQPTQVPRQGTDGVWVIRLRGGGGQMQEEWRTCSVPPLNTEGRPVCAAIHVQVQVQVHCIG